MNPPVVFPYQQALDQFRREGREPPLLKRMSELISLLDLTTTLNSTLSASEILDAAILIVMGELQASRGGLFVQAGASEHFMLKAGRGLPPGAPQDLELPTGEMAPVLLRGEAGQPAAFDPWGFEVLCPIEKAGRPIAVLGLGPRAEARSYGEGERAFLRSLAACAATPIENGLIYDQLRQVNQKLSLKIFQLNNLFDISRELTSSFDEESIKNVVTSTLMGQLMVSRCVLYLSGPGGLLLAHERGVRCGPGAVTLPEPAARVFLESLTAAVALADLPPGPVRELLAGLRLALVVPLSLGGGNQGFLAAGERLRGDPFSEEDREFANTLGRQAAAALESVRLHRIRLEKERQDRDLQIAREIQRSLFPSSHPATPGFEIAAESRPCYQVGGDYYDLIPLPDGRVVLAIADVSGKSTPASILMASVHASLRALVGTATPQMLVDRLNRFLFESTQANKFVTLFYGELQPAARRLRYVNAGHIPPFLVRADGSSERLERGGPVLGLLPDAVFDLGEVELRSQDLVVTVTDGATEALSPKEEEFGDQRILQTLARSRGQSADDTLHGLVAAVDEWTGAAGCSDDLTLLVLKAR